RLSALRPSAVSRYTVFGRRSAKDLVQLRYLASSSLRACALKLPSLTSNSAFSSLKLSSSRTARALRMPRRTRSYTSRSNFVSSLSPRPVLSAVRLGRLCAAADGVARALALSVMGVPSDEQSKQQVQATEARTEDDDLHAGRQEQRDDAKGHEAAAHIR